MFEEDRNSYFPFLFFMLKREGEKERLSSFFSLCYFFCLPLFLSFLYFAELYIQKMMMINKMKVSE